MILPYKEYLGDSVYIEYNGRELILTTENRDRPSNTIVLDTIVLGNLLLFVDKLKNMD